MRRKFLLLLALLLVSLPLQRALADDVKLLAVVRAATKVYTGPGDDFKILGVLKLNGKLYLSGRDSTSEWGYFLYYGKPGWATLADLIVEGQVTGLPVYGKDGTAQRPDVILKGYSIEPATPAPGERFKILVALQNRGNLDAGLFAVGTTFPSGDFALVNVPFIAAGETVQAVIECPGERATGMHTITLAIDVNRQLDQPVPAKLPTLKYWIDAARSIQSTLRIVPYSNVDLWGETMDLAFDGQVIIPINGAKIFPLTASFTEIHRDMLLKGVAVPQITPRPGLLFGIITAEKQPGVVRVNRWSEGDVVIDFFVY